MKIDHVRQLFAVFEGRCHDCGADVKVEIVPTEDGFKIEGGAVYGDMESQRLKCDGCYDADPVFRERC